MEDCKTRVMLVDDHSVFREGLRELLDRWPDIEVVAEAGTGWQALEQMTCRPDVIVLDIKLPDVDGIAVCRSILEADDGVRIVMLTMYGEDEYLFEALQAGASGFVMKSANSEEVVSSIRAASRGQSKLDPSTTARVLEEYRRLALERSVGTPRPLSERDLTMLALIAEGATNREIAAHLAISEQTVKNVLSVLYQKLGVRKRAEAVRVILKENIPLPRVRRKLETELARQSPKLEDIAAT
jgi:DNA-binding NarL/FixJ family response regulator